MAAQPPGPCTQTPTPTLWKHAEEYVVPALVRRVQAAVHQPDAPHATALGMTVLEAAGAGELRHEGREQQRVVILRGDLNGLVVLVLAHLDVAAHVDHRVGRRRGSVAGHSGGVSGGVRGGAESSSSASLRSTVLSVTSLAWSS